MAMKVTRKKTTTTETTSAPETAPMPSGPVETTPPPKGKKLVRKLGPDGRHMFVYE